MTKFAEAYEKLSGWSEVRKPENYVISLITWDKI